MIFCREPSQEERMVMGLQKLMVKELQKSLNEMTDGEIISMDPDPLKTKTTDVVPKEEQTN